VGAGLFGKTENALIKNVGIENARIYSGAKYVGALVGYGNYITISNCYSTGKVKSTAGANDASRAGGLIGEYYWNGQVDNCYSTVDVSGDYSVGGLMGGAGDNVINCYATGDVAGAKDSYVGGIFGGLSRSSASSYWNKNARHQIGGNDLADGDKKGVCFGVDETYGKTLSELKQQATYTGWDFNEVWAINPNVNDGLPYLRGFMPG
jgi:hypothetical protein